MVVASTSRVMVAGAACAKAAVADKTTGSHLRPARQADREKRKAIGFTPLSGLYDTIVPCHTAIMSMSRSRASRVFTISFPEDLAQQVEKLAQQESRDISELFREAFRSYRLERIHRKLRHCSRQNAGRQSPDVYGRGCRTPRRRDPSRAFRWSGGREFGYPLAKKVRQGRTTESSPARSAG